MEAVKGFLFESLALVMLAGLVFTRVTWGKNEHQVSTWLKWNYLCTEYWTKRPYFVPAISYLIVVIISTLFSNPPGVFGWVGETNQGGLFTLCLVIEFMVVAEVVQRIETVEKLVSSILLASVPVALYGCIQYLGLDPLTWQTNSLSRVHSTTGYSLYLGAYLAMVIPFTLSQLFVSPRENWIKHNFSYLVILAVQVVSLYFTLSRSALIGMLVGCGVFLVFTIPAQKRRILVGLLLTLIVIGGIFVLGVSYGWQITPLGRQPNILRSNIAATRQLSDADRLRVWKLTLPMIVLHPWVGYGPDNFKNAYEEYYPLSRGKTEENNSNWDAHNLVLSQLIAVGILGLAAYCWILITFYRGIYHFWRSAPGRLERLLAATLLASVTAYLVQAQFIPTGIVTTIILSLLLGAGVGISYPRNAVKPFSPLAG